MIPTCRHGKPHGPQEPRCEDCARSVEFGCQRFDLAVLAGVYNPQGYTPAEWVKAGYARETWRDCGAEALAEFVCGAP